MERKQFCLQRAFRNVWRLLFALIGDQEQCIIYYTEAKEAASYFTKHSSFPPTANTNNRCNLCQGWKTLVVSSVTVVWRVCVKFVGTKLMNIKPGQSRSQKPWEKRNWRLRAISSGVWYREADRESRGSQQPGESSVLEETGIQVLCDFHLESLVVKGRRENDLLRGQRCHRKSVNSAFFFTSQFDCVSG